MPLTGTLRTWHDDRGFGFIAPTDGGRELFVHISAFPPDGSRPVQGESLSYELGLGNDGKPAAVRAYRQALGRPATYPPRSRASPARDPQRRGWAFSVMALVLVAAVGSYGYTHVKNRLHRQQLEHTPPSSGTGTDVAPAQPALTSFRCDGRTHCSQMTSCTEAKFFINNCPGTRMDGNHDGVPCEQQWCTSPAR